MSIGVVVQEAFWSVALLDSRTSVLQASHPKLRAFGMPCGWCPWCVLRTIAILIRSVLAASLVVFSHPAIDTVPQVLVHAHSDRICGPHKEIHEICLERGVQGRQRRVDHLNELLLSKQTKVSLPCAAPLPRPLRFAP